MIKITESNDLNQLYPYYMNKTLKDKTFVLLSSEDFMRMVKKGFARVSQEGLNINGFMIWHMREKQCYITMLIGDSIEIKNSLLEAFESNLRKDGQTNEILIHFMNPISLAWYPKKNVVHPCYQGVLLDEENFELYQHHAYLVHSIQDTYYRELSSFVIPDDVISHLKLNEKDGIEIAFYDTQKHKGLIEFTEDIHAPHWRDVILDNEKAEHVLPLLVALKHNQVIGFTGPLKVEPNGRGYFAGIGILESERGKKIGKTLFFMLCQRLKEMGASYMTLYTGNQNPARFIYLDAGFKVLKSFATMKKTIK